MPLKQRFLFLNIWYVANTTKQNKIQFGNLHGTITNMVQSFRFDQPTLNVIQYHIFSDAYNFLECFSLPEIDI